MKIREELLKLKDEKYKEFSSKLTRTNYSIIGVRVPIIKKLAKDISKFNSFEYFDCLTNPFFEEVMLEGLLIGYLKDISEVINRLNKFIKKIDDWSVCDSVCSNLKITNKNRDIMWHYIVSYKYSCKEFEVRFMLIMMLDYYLDEKYISKVFDIIDKLKCDEYYVKMAVAWLLATSFVKCEKETFEYVKRCNLDKFTFNKMISKCVESYRISKELKELLRKIKK